MAKIKHFKTKIITLSKVEFEEEMKEYETNKNSYSPKPSETRIEKQSEFEERINNFLKDKNLIDIKVVQSYDQDEGSGSTYISYLVIYE